MKNLFKALANFQQEVPVIHKGTIGYGYSYADLPEVFRVVVPLMKKHGLGFTQLGIGNAIKTVVFHVDSGESISGEFTMPDGVELKGMNAYQVMGSGITYIRRYSLACILGLITDIDNDASDNIPNTNQNQQITTNGDNVKPWLNKNTKEYERVLSAIQQGYSMAEIEQKYKLSRDVKSSLLKIMGL